MKLTGRYIEKLGYWRPRSKKTYDRSIALNFHKVRYWLGNGAKPTKPVKRLLSKFDFWPQVPPPQGSKYLYDRPEKEYSQHAMDILHKVHNMDRDTPLKEKIKAEIHKMETLNSFERSMYSQVDIEKVQTTDIDSDDPDVIERSIKFEELKRRFANHRQYSLDVMNANDFKFNNYLRKMDKLSNKKYGGIDIEGYRDYLNNLMEINKIKADIIDERDKMLGDTLEIDYSGKEGNASSPPTGRAMSDFYNINSLATVREKAERLEKTRQMFIKILKDEIEAKNRHLSKFAKDSENK